jgi:predicted secreted protein
MYRVSPIPKPITPLATITATASMGKLAMAPALPNANRIIMRTTALLAQRMMLAEMGFILNKERL